MKIYLMRHGEAVDDIEDCYGGVADFELTDAGREQASALGKKLEKSGLTKLYSSPLKRAKETAEIIADGLGLKPVTVVSGLQERNSYGVLSGINKARAKEIFGHILAELKEKPGYSKEPILGGEGWDEFVTRVNAAFNEVIADATESGAESIGVVTHGKFSKALLEDVLRIDEPYDLKLSALNIINYTPPASRLN